MENDVNCNGVQFCTDHAKIRSDVNRLTLLHLIAIGIELIILIRVMG